MVKLFRFIPFPLVAVLLMACGSAIQPGPVPTVAPTPDPDVEAAAQEITASVAPAPEVVRHQEPGAKCVMASDRLPDPVCTPGTYNPDVTQANIKTTICKSGWTATIRPPTTYTNQLKADQMKEYGFTQSSRWYEEDHLVPLELGGDPMDPLNLWPEPEKNPNPKDKVENGLKALVCEGKMTLAEARTAIQTDWTTALPAQ